MQKAAFYTDALRSGKTQPSFLLDTSRLLKPNFSVRWTTGWGYEVHRPPGSELGDGYVA